MPLSINPHHTSDTQHRAFRHRHKHLSPRHVDHCTCDATSVQTLSAYAEEYILQRLVGFNHVPLYEWIPATKTSSVFGELMDNADDEEDPSMEQQVLQAATEESQVVSTSDKACHCILKGAA